MRLKSGTFKESDVMIYWKIFIKAYKGISISESAEDLNKAFINYFGQDLTEEPIKVNDLPKYCKCFKIKDKIYTIKWSIDKSESKKLFANLGEKAFDIMICEVDINTFNHKSSRHLLQFMIHEIPKESIKILEKLIYGKI